MHKSFGDFPARHGHGLEKVRLENNQTSLILFWGGNKGILNDFYECKTSEITVSKTKLTWKQFEPRMEPGILPRAGFATCSHGSKIFIFGGIQEDENGDSMSNEMLEFDLEQRTIKRLVSYAESPPKRLGTSMIYVDKGSESYIMIYGGLSDAKAPLNDMWKFTVSGSRWEKVSFRKGFPTARESHCAMYYKSQDKEYMIVYGGFCIRNNHVERLKEVVFVDLEALSWEYEVFKHKGAHGRALHSCIIAGEHMYALGGFVQFKSGNEYLWRRSNEFIRYNLGF